MWTTPDPLVNVAEALALDWTTVERLAEEDRQERLREWERWVSEPVPMYLVVRLMAAIYVRMGLPAEVTTPEHAEAGRKEGKSEAEIVRKLEECERAVVQQIRGGLPWS
jgi:hypothetical protein